MTRADTDRRCTTSGRLARQAGGRAPRRPGRGTPGDARRWSPGGRRESRSPGSIATCLFEAGYWGTVMSPSVISVISFLPWALIAGESL